MRDRKGMDLGDRAGRETLEGVQIGEKHNWNILSEKIYFQKEEKIKRKQMSIDLGNDIERETLHGGL